MFQKESRRQIIRFDYAYCRVICKEDEPEEVANQNSQPLLVYNVLTYGKLCAGKVTGFSGIRHCGNFFADIFLFDCKF